ncbi:hypothetical protein SAMN05444167_0735 [Terriglobus roseus]|uniref:Uncharacterized protein n=1 Tax=Terriglobus roseus TaxID=392734 RepID=A0A1G7GLF8_9BACT|nr:hypothetical protein SAMN05444167_0735 [Terriglobus roseus]
MVQLLPLQDTLATTVRWRDYCTTLQSTICHGIVSSVRVARSRCQVREQGNNAFGSNLKVLRSRESASTWGGLNIYSSRGKSMNSL